jgi:Rod binding domain-containing protein
VIDPTAIVPASPAADSHATSATHASPVSQNMTPAQISKLRKAAADFESILLSTFWKSMKDSFASDDDDSLDPAHDTLEDMGMQAMSSAVGKAGGLGLGKLILKHIAPDVPFRPGAPVQDPPKLSPPSADSEG